MTHKPIKLMPHGSSDLAAAKNETCDDCGVSVWNDMGVGFTFKDIEKEDCIERHHDKTLCGNCMNNDSNEEGSIADKAGE